MKNSPLKDKIALLIQDGAIIQNVNFGILFSYNRNDFFAYLERYIQFYNSIRDKTLLNGHISQPLDNDLRKIPELKFEDYSISKITLFILLTTIPVSWIIFMFQWNYIKELKKNLSAGLQVFKSVLKENP